MHRRKFLELFTVGLLGLALAPKAEAIPVKPIHYYNGSQELNPPKLKCWAVAKGFPRKHK